MQFRAGTLLLRRRAALAVTAALVLGATLIVAPGANADPIHDKIAKTKAEIGAAQGRLDDLHQKIADTQARVSSVQGQLDAVTTRVDAAVEQYDASRISLANARRTAQAARGAVSGAEHELAASRGALDGLASSAYRNGSTDQLAQLFLAANPSDYLARAGALDQLARGQAETIHQVSVARHDLDAKRSAADEAVGVEQHVADQLASVKARIEADLHSQQQLLASVQQSQQQLEQMATAQAAQATALATELSHEVAQAAAQQREIAAVRARALAQAQQALAAAKVAAGRRAAAARAAVLTAASSAAGGRDTGGGGGDNAGGGGGAVQDGGAAPAAPAPAYKGSATGRGAAAVAYAYAQLGKPYQWGADGPGTFDCSGLTLMAWRQAGVSLTHFSQAQRGEGAQISQSAVRPGDLVFFGSPIHHVGIYVGNGQMISAPHTGDVVKLQSAFRSDYVGATRPA